MSQNIRRSRVPVIPAVVAAMQNDPRVAAAQAAMRAGSSTAPVTGIYDGLARVLQGGLGGFMNRRNNMSYLRDQARYMDDTNAAYRTISGGASTIPPIPGIAPPGPGTGGPMSPPPPPVAAPPPMQSKALPNPSPLPLPAPPDAGLPPVPGAVDPMSPAPVMSPPGPAQVPEAGPGDIGSSRPPFQLPAPITGDQPSTAGNAPLSDIATMLSQLQPDMGGGGPAQMPGSSLAQPSPNIGIAAPTPATVPTPGSLPTIGGGAPDIMQPGMPNAPNVPGAPDSARTRLGRAMMSNGNPYSFSEGLHTVDAGMEEDAHNAELRAQRQFQLDSGRYETQLNDYGAARNAARGATYDQQSQARGFAHADATQERGYAHEDAAQLRSFDHDFQTLERTQGFQSSQADRQRAYEGWQFRSQILGQEAPGGPDAYNTDQPGRFNVGGWEVGDGYGASRGGGTRIHQGQDTFARAGTPFPVGSPIRIIESHRQTSGSGDGGNIATVEFPDGSRWMAMHLPNLPAPGQYAAGSNILRAGTTGNAQGGSAHIHWQPANDLAHMTYRQGRAATMSFLTGQPIAPAAGATPGAARTVNIGPGAPGRPLPQRIEQEISAAAGTTDQVLNLTSRFNDNYVGYGSDTLGNAALGVERRLPGASDRVDWWADYNNMNNAVRHNLFGSALTATEQAQWERSTITPGTSAPVARHMLETQNRLLQSALIRRARGSAAAGYNGGQIYELIGPDLVTRMGQPSGVRPGPEVGADGATPRITANGATYERNGQGQWTVVQAAPQARGRSGGMMGTGIGAPGTRPSRRYTGPTATYGAPMPQAQMPNQRPWFMR